MLWHHVNNCRLANSMPSILHGIYICVCVCVCVCGYHPLKTPNREKLKKDCDCLSKPIL